MNYKDYKTARDAAWRILIRFKTSKLPVRISDGIKQMGIALAPYSRAGAFLDEIGLAHLTIKTSGLSVRAHGKYYIFYRGDMVPGRIRFTVAHELGHIVLGHLCQQPFTTRNQEPQKGDTPIEQAANVFASRLLAPACVLHALDVYTPEQISELCDISLTAARFRADRMEALRKRNMFGTSPLERQVYEQFRDYIKSQLPYPDP